MYTLPVASTATRYGSLRPPVGTTLCAAENFTVRLGVACAGARPPSNNSAQSPATVTNARPLFAPEALIEEKMNRLKENRSARKADADACEVMCGFRPLSDLLGLALGLNWGP